MLTRLTRFRPLLRYIPHIALVMAAVLTAVTTGLSLAGARAPDADVINMVWPFGLIIGLSALVISLLCQPRGLGRLRRATQILGLVLIALALPYEQWRPRPVDGQHVEPPADTLRLASFNAWGWRNTEIGQIHDQAKTWDLDVLALQEYNARRFPPFENLPHIHACRLGVTVASRWPIVQRGCQQEPGLALAWVTLDHASGPITVMSVHFPRPTSPARYTEAMAILGRMIQTQTAERLILAGDFNTAEKGHQMRRLTRILSPLHRVSRGLRTWPSHPISPWPIIGIDHVWLSPDLCAHAVTTGPHLGSDHRPVLASITACPS